MHRQGVSTFRARLDCCPTSVLIDLFRFSAWETLWITSSAASNKSEELEVIDKNRNVRVSDVVDSVGQRLAVVFHI